jgi:hypothetical protein
MPLRLARNRLYFDGACGVDEALTLQEYLSRPKPPKIDLQACTHLHTALAQVLAAFRPSRPVPPDDPFLASWLMPLIGQPSCLE